MRLIYPIPPSLLVRTDKVISEYSVNVPYCSCSQPLVNQRTRPIARSSWPLIGGSADIHVDVMLKAFRKAIVAN